MKLFLLAFTFLISFISFNQDQYLLSPQEKAYLFHTVKKSPILNQNIGRYFEFKGKAITLPNGKINYDSTELVIINNPELLFIRSSEIAKSPKGILAEAANKMALWELNKLLLSKRKNDLEKDQLQSAYTQFEKILISKLPVNALKEKNNKRLPHPKLDNVFDPSITFDNKITMLGSLKALSLNDRRETIKAMNFAINKWVEDRSFEIFKTLGGKADSYTNILTAAGDGSTTSGLFEEREKDERGRYNKGLPKAVGLFPYETFIKTTGKKKKTKSLEPSRYSSVDLVTYGKGKETNLHLDVWGYNAEKQTTVVIEKAGKSYPLFGSADTRFLSPDSAYTGKATFYSIIHLIEKDIEDLNEMLYGKKGFDYWIAYYEKKKEQKLLDITKHEKLLSDMRGSSYSTNKKGNAIGGGKKRKAKQEELLRHYQLLAGIKKKIKEFEIKKEKALDMLTLKNKKLNLYQDLIGRDWMDFENDNGLYLFADSTRFDLMTQEFTFPATEKEESFEIRLIAIPYSQNSEEADEVMLHINLTDAKPKYDARVQFNLEDVFASDQYKLENNIISKEDSVAVTEFFEAMLNKKTDFNVIARGQGIGVWNGARVVKGKDIKELSRYPGADADKRAQSKESEAFKTLRFSEVIIAINREINFEVNSYTDAVTSNFNTYSETFKAKAAQYKLTNNDVLSAYRTHFILEKLRKEMNVLAGKYLSRTEAKKVIDRLNKKINKTKITVACTSFKMVDF